MIFKFLGILLLIAAVVAAIDAITEHWRSAMYWRKKLENYTVKNEEQLEIIKQIFTTKNESLPIIKEWKDILLILHLTHSEKLDDEAAIIWDTSGADKYKAIRGCSCIPYSEDLEDMVVFVKADRVYLKENNIITWENFKERRFL